MTVGELKKLLEKVPDNAIVFVEADHGQEPERANYLNVTTKKLPDDSDDIDWNGSNKVKAKAILIS